MSPMTLLVLFTVILLSSFSALAIPTPLPADATGAKTTSPISSPQNDDHRLQQAQRSTASNFHTADATSRYESPSPLITSWDKRPRRSQNGTTSTTDTPANHPTAKTINSTAQTNGPVCSLHKVLIAEPHSMNTTLHSTTDAIVQENTDESKGTKWYNAEWVTIATWALWLFVIAAALGLLALWGRGAIDGIGEWVVVVGGEVRWGLRMREGGPREVERRLRGIGVV